MNAAIRCAVRLGLQRGHTPVAIFNGFRGLIDGDVRPLNWLDVDGWAVKGGSEIGTNRTLPSADFGSIACQLQRFRIEALMIVGGFEAFSSLIELVRARSMYPAFCIPMVVVPATVSNNVPGTDFSLGSDTALNAIVSACDVIRQSASASRKRVFVVEVQGGHCGYLATLAGLAAGSSRTYIPEEGISLYDLVRDSEILKFKYEEEVERSEGRVILRNEQASNVYTTKMITDILQEEGKGFYDCREAVLGHLQQGGAPSPLDRIRGTRFAVRTMKFLEEQAHKALADAESGRNQSAGTHIQRIYSPDPNNCVVIGLKGARAEFTPVLQLLDNCDLKKRRAKDQWWMSLRPLLDILSKYEPEKN
jgi:6-phosphofructokinase 1